MMIEINNCWGDERDVLAITVTLVVTCVCGIQMAKGRRIIKNADKRKEKNRITHSAPGSIKVKPARKKHVVAQLE